MKQRLIFIFVAMVVGCGQPTNDDAMVMDASLMDGSSTHMNGHDASSAAVDAMADTAQSMPVQNVLLKTLYFARQDNMVSEGFNLDGLTTRLGEPAGCGIADFTNESGEDGIDNQFAILLPMIENAGGMAIESYATAAVLSGNLLLMLELDNVDSMKNDPQVSLGVYRALGTPSIGADGEIEAWQTFDLDVNDHWLRVDDARIEEGVLRAEGFQFTVPFYIFDFAFEIVLFDAQVVVEFGEDGAHRGMFGGAVDIENILFITENIDGGDQLPPLVRTIGRTLADMRPDADGNCQALSVAMNFETVGAYFYEDTPRIEDPNGSGE